jgi:shikimate kinase
MKNIILTGFMGAGKTTLAKILAQKTNYQVMEMDDWVLKISKRKSINQIFFQDGELKFRELEIATAKKLAKKERVIISTGGGVVMNKIILDYLKQKGIVFFLQTNFITIKQRLKNDKTRPLFKDNQKAFELYQFRQPLYQKYADFIIKTDNQKPNQIAREIYKNEHFWKD